jgi:tetratricopeptide (TPR) repeat protein
MSKKKYKEDKAEKKLGAIDEKLTASEQFLEKNQNAILYGLAALVVIVGLFLVYRYLYIIPKNEKAQAAIFKGERYFQDGEDSLALFGNNNDYIGFEAIIDQYRGTKTANLAHAYAGICYSRLGDNEKALRHLNKFKGKDLLIAPAVIGAMGDVYMNMNNPKEAIAHYKKAADKANDEMLAPIYYKKIGQVYLHQKDYDKAIETFTKIKDTYLNSPEGQEADKYIEQAKLQSQGQGQE